MIWELQRHHWARLRGPDGSTVGRFPDLVQAIARAQTDAEARDLGQALSELVSRQGSLFEAAPPAVSSVIALLHGSTPPGREQFLVQLAYWVTGETAAEERMYGTDLREACSEELLKGWSEIESLLSSQVEAERMYALDLIGLLGLAFPGQRLRARWLTEKVAEEYDLARDPDVASWLEELSG